MRISHKLPAIMIGLAAFSILVTTTVAYLDARLKLQDQAQDALVMARDDRSHELQAYLRGIEEDLLLVADSSIATTALAASSRGDALSPRVPVSAGAAGKRASEAGIFAWFHYDFRSVWSGGTVGGLTSSEKCCDAEAHVLSSWPIPGLLSRRRYRHG